MFPIEKYRFYVTGRKVIAVSTYAGKVVRGVAICAPEDEFDLKKGKQLAAARCNVNVAKKRIRHAQKKLDEALKVIVAAKDHYRDMLDYGLDASNALKEASSYLNTLIDQY